MKRNLTLVLFAFFSLVFNSCVAVRVFSFGPDEYLGYEKTSESGTVYHYTRLSMSESRKSLLHGYFQHIFPSRYVNYSVTITIRNFTGDFNNDEDIMLYMYIDECRIVLPSGSTIDLLDNNNNIVNYSYTDRDYKVRAPPKTLQNVQPQYTEDGRKALYLDALIDNTLDEVWIKFIAKIPSSAQTFRLEYTLTVVWENMGEVKMRSNLLFLKNRFRSYNPFTV